MTDEKRLRKQRVEFTIENDELTRIEEKAKKEGLKPSAYCKRLVFLEVFKE